MLSNTDKKYSYMYCSAEFIALKPDDIHTKPNKNRINRNDIETLCKCNECGKNNKLYWSEQKKP